MTYQRLVGQKVAKELRWQQEPDVQWLHERQKLQSGHRTRNFQKFWFRPWDLKSSHISGHNKGDDRTCTRFWFWPQKTPVWNISRYTGLAVGSGRLMVMGWRTPFCYVMGRNFFQNQHIFFVKKETRPCSCLFVTRLFSTDHFKWARDITFSGHLVPTIAGSSSWTHIYTYLLKLLVDPNSKNCKIEIKSGNRIIAKNL